MRISTARVVAAVVLLAAILATVALTLTPLELPELAVPSRIYARPHRIFASGGADASGLIRNLRRLGYREIRWGDPRPGEFRRDQRRVVVNRRPFQSPLVASPEGRIEVRLERSGRVASIRDGAGRRLPSVLLEPEVIGTFHGQQREDRYLVPLDEIPVHLIDAILMIEDRRFFEHSGLDLRRLAGAMLANLRAGGVVQGGSTLTQQLVKNLYLGQERTLVRKLREAWLALRLERGHTKEEILEAYLNVIYLGQRGPVSVRGVEAASRHYFGKHVQQLSLAESAMIAGLVRGPGLYSPYGNVQAAIERRNLVLSVLHETGRISERNFNEARVVALGVLEEPPVSVSAPYFTALVERELRAELPGADLERQGLAVFTGLDADLQLVAQAAVKRGLAQLEADFPNLVRESSPLQAALMALDPRSGEILALVGGRDWGASQFDRTTQAHRQPGSVFKPVVALAALARGPEGVPPFTLASLLEDEPLTVETPEGPWTPTNHDGSFRGWTSLRGALEQSINVPVARLGLRLGPERIIRIARRLGIESRLAPVPSLALGAFETTPLEIARAYGVLASGGIRAEPRSYVRVVDIDGRTLLVHEPKSVRVFDPAETSLVTSALEGAVDHGTARALRGYGFRGPVAGKTGTTNEFRDAWFVGYTPDLVGAVWVGFDDGASIGLPGSRAALPIFADFITSALGREGGRDFETPPGVEIVRVNRETGLRAGWACPGERELFLAGSAPVERCGPGWMRTARRADGPEPDGEARRPGGRSPEPTWVRIFDAVLDVIDEVTREAR